jgi:hypothetical protein
MLSQDMERLIMKYFVSILTFSNPHCSLLKMQTQIKITFFSNFISYVCEMSLFRNYPCAVITKVTSRMLQHEVLMLLSIDFLFFVDV